MRYFSVLLKVGFQKHGSLAARRSSVYTAGFGNFSELEWKITETSETKAIKDPLDSHFNEDQSRMV